MKKICKDCGYPVGQNAVCPFCQCEEQFEACTKCNSILAYAPECHIGFCPACAFGEGDDFATV